VIARTSGVRIRQRNKLGRWFIGKQINIGFSSKVIFQFSQNWKNKKLENQK
jgi:hypothetical protein